MLTLRAVPTVAILQVVLLTALGALWGWGAAGWVAGFVTLGVADVAAAHLARAYRIAALGPADVVTLSRTALACGIVALVTDPAVADPTRTAGIAALGTVALVLDRVDGVVARRTGTGSAYGGKIDGEADAFLLLVLSVPAAEVFGWWVLLIGLARYAFAVAGWPLPWLRAQLPFRYWRKVVTATAGIALTVAVAGVLPETLAALGLVVALALIGESFVRDIWWLWAHAPVRHPEPAAGGPA